MCRAYNWHSKCKDTMKIRHRKCREGNTISSPWFECRTGTRIMPVYIQLKETILCCLPCISCDVFSSCLCIDCANCERDVYLDTPYSTMCNKYGTGITQTSRRTPAKHTMMAHLDLFSWALFIHEVFFWHGWLLPQLPSLAPPSFPSSPRSVQYSLINMFVYTKKIMYVRMYIYNYVYMHISSPRTFKYSRSNMYICSYK